MSSSATFASSSHFNPRSSCEERPYVYLAIVFSPYIFQSTLLMRGATCAYCRPAPRRAYFNPRSSCEERPRATASRSAPSANFNPRSSCEERLNTVDRGVKANPFQSTLLMRGATLHRATARVKAADFNPRSSCEERRAGAAALRFGFAISIHAPHARSDVPA